MRNREVEKHINTAVSNSVPDVLDNILTKCETKRGFNENMKKEKTNLKVEKSFRIPKLAIGACAIILLFGFTFMGVNQYNNVFKANSIIEFDVNPSIELKINKKEDVIEAIALNEDAKKVLEGMDLKKVDLSVAVNAIVGSMLKNGYLTIDQNSILVSVKNDNKDESARLQKEITDEIDSLLAASSIDGSVLTQEFDDKDDNLSKLSNDYSISVGKAKLINNVITAKITNSKGELYTFDTLAGLSINELNLLLSEKSTKVENVKSSGVASESGYIGKEKAKTIAFTDAKTKESKVKELEIEFDADDGRLIYEIEFRVGSKEYEYDIHAKSGEIIHKETDIDEEYIDDDKKTNSSTSSNKNNTSSSTNGTTSSTYIGKEKAKSIAFKNAGVSSGSVKELEVELDEDDGVHSYEIEFKVGNKEYKYDIHAKTGKVLDKEVDIDN